MTLTGDTAYRTESRAVYDPPLNGMQESHITLEGKYAGPCRDGLVPGDFIGPNGQKFNLKGIGAGKGAMPPTAQPKQSRKGPAMSHNLYDTFLEFKLASGTDRQLLLAARARARRRRPGVAPAGVDPHRARVGAAQLRRQEGHRRARARARQLEARPGRGSTRSRSWSRASCCRTSPACRCWPTSRRCATSRQDLGKNPKTIEPLVPVDLVVDHSVMIDHYGTKDALDLNMKLEFERNGERYQFMKWGMQAFDTFGVVPPGIGIVHQVNLEYLARGVHQKNGVVLPRLAGRHRQPHHDGQRRRRGRLGRRRHRGRSRRCSASPCTSSRPTSSASSSRASCNEGITATDLVLTITEMLRKEKVVGKFVEFFGEGTASLSVPDRATIGNMAPEYGATMGFFPVDQATVDYLAATGRTRGRDRRVRVVLQGAGDVRHSARPATSTTPRW